MEATWTVRRARDEYLAENGFTLEAYESRWTDASFLGLPLRVPNTRRHRWAIMLHDLHHVATGFGTDLTGEGEISAWELRSGTRSLGLYVGSIVVSGAVMGAVMASRRIAAAWERGAEATNLFAQLPPEDDAAYEALLALDVATLRAKMGLPAAGIASGPRGLHDFAPPSSAVAQLAREEVDERDDAATG